MDTIFTPERVLESYKALQADLEADPSETELGQKNKHNDIRTIITNRTLSGAGLSVVGEVKGVTYGTWNTQTACLLVVKFYFKLADQRLNFEHLDISIVFRNSAGSKDEIGEDPVVRALAPRKLHGFSSARRRARRWEIEKLHWKDQDPTASNISHVSFGPGAALEDEHDTSVTGSVWFPNRRHKPHQAVWQITNEVGKRTRSILDELDLAVVV